MKLTGMLLILLGMAQFALAVPANAPEIDGSTLVSGVTLATGALLVIRGRRK
jgi:hypothetical protein